MKLIYIQFVKVAGLLILFIQFMAYQKELLGVAIKKQARGGGI